MPVADNIRSDNKFMRLAVLLEPEITRMLDQQSSRTYGHDDYQLDSNRGVVTYFARGHMIWEARVEVIGAFLPDFGLWRWWWTGRVVSDSRAKCSMDLAYSEGQRHQIATLTNEHPRVAVEDDAQLISNVCAHLARADGVLRHQDDEKVTYYALFDTGKVKRSSAVPRDSMPRGASATAIPVAGAQRSNVPQALAPAGEREFGGAEPAAPPRAAVSVPRQAVPKPSASAPARGDAGFRQEAPTGVTSVRRQEVPRPTQMPGALAEFAREPGTSTGVGRLQDLAAAQAAPPPGFGDTREARYSVPDLDDPFGGPGEARGSATYVARETTSTAMMTIAPSAMSQPAPRAAPAPVREPTREVVLPVVQLAAAAVAAAMPGGFHQALIVVNVEIHDGKARFSALVCASDERGEITLVDTSRDLIEAAGRMIAEDARSGNGRWRRLTAKLSRTQRGAAIDVTVK